MPRSDVPFQRQPNDDEHALNLVLARVVEVENVLKARQLLVPVPSHEHIELVALRRVRVLCKAFVNLGENARKLRWL